MSSSEEMRRVIEHAAGQLEAVLEQENATTYPNKKTIQAVAALSYSVAVMRLLASYLVVTDQPDPVNPNPGGPLEH